MCAATLRAVLPSRSSGSPRTSSAKTFLQAPPMSLIGRPPHVETRSLAVSRRSSVLQVHRDWGRHLSRREDLKCHLANLRSLVGDNALLALQKFLSGQLQSLKLLRRKVNPLNSRHRTLSASPLASEKLLSAKVRGLPGSSPPGSVARQQNFD